MMFVAVEVLLRMKASVVLLLKKLGTRRATSKNRSAGTFRQRVLILIIAVADYHLLEGQVVRNYGDQW
jgi:hypothetical protein